MKMSESEADPPMSDVPAIVTNIQQLESWYSFWTKAGIVLGTAAAVCTILAAAAGIVAYLYNSRLKVEQDELIRAKDQQLTRELKDKDLQIENVRAAAQKDVEDARNEAKERLELETKRVEGEAGRKIEDARAEAGVKIEQAKADADAKAAELAREQTKLAEEQRKTADAQLKADEARMALENLLKQRTEPRTLTAEQRTKLIKALKAYPHRSPVSPSVTVTWVQGNDESQQYALQFVEVFREAGWNLYGERGSPNASVTFSGLDVAQNGGNSQMLDFVRSALQDVGLFATGNVTGVGNKVLGQGSLSNIPLPSARWRAGGEIIFAVGLRP